jgi:hypothetical protein
MAMSSTVLERAAMAACGAILWAAVAGCTMCPDPLDYSGPVPGSAPQNDFRARSNGILPLGVAPSPWPPVVQASGDEAAPDPPESAAEALADAGDVDPPDADVVVAGLDDVAEESAVEVEDAVEPATVEEPFPDILPPPRSPRPERRPPLRESLGWKPRG